MFQSRQNSIYYKLLSVVPFHNLPENFTRMWRERKDLGSIGGWNAFAALRERVSGLSAMKAAIFSRVKIRSRDGLSLLSPFRPLASLFFLTPNYLPSYLFGRVCFCILNYIYLNYVESPYMISQMVIHVLNFCVLDRCRKLDSCISIQWWRNYARASRKLRHNVTKSRIAKSFRQVILINGFFIRALST